MTNRLLVNGLRLGYIRTYVRIFESGRNGRCGASRPGTIDSLAHQHAKGHPVGSPGWQPIAARRADALIALILGTSTIDRSPIKTTLELTMDLPTLLGLRNNPAEHTGRLLDLGHTTYHPSEPLARYPRARERVCSIPTCNRPARRCHLDHAKPYSPGDPNGGRTDAVNGGPLCETHHRLKHETDWTLRRDPDNGDATWNTPTGHTHHAEPHDYRPLPLDDLPAEPPLPAPNPALHAIPTPDEQQYGNLYVPDDPDTIPDPDEERPHLAFAPDDLAA